jgi:hypothetical protein
MDFLIGFWNWNMFATWIMIKLDLVVVLVDTLAHLGPP